jgi:hypothetical protein
MPTAQYPIPADLVEAFGAAIQAVRDWHRYVGAPYACIACAQTSRFARYLGSGVST